MWNVWRKSWNRVLCYIYKQNLSKQIQSRKAKEVISYQLDVNKITPLIVLEVNEAEKEIFKFVQRQNFQSRIISFKSSQLCLQGDGENSNQESYKEQQNLKAQSCFRKQPHLCRRTSAPSTNHKQC